MLNAITSVPVVAARASRQTRRTSSVSRVRVTATATTERKAGPLARGGTKSGSEALGVVPSEATLLAAAGLAMSRQPGDKFSDPRWVKGTWDFAQFKAADGNTDWDAVIDAEAGRRRYLEAFPEPSLNEDEVKFDTSMVPLWAWVKRFHLPQAELINGRAAMIGYATGYFVDLLTHNGLVSQTDNFFGKTLMLLTFFGCAFVRNTKDLEGYKGLINEATFYDKQWNATWEGVERPSEKKD